MTKYAEITFLINLKKKEKQKCKRDLKDRCTIVIYSALLGSPEKVGRVFFSCFIANVDDKYLIEAWTDGGGSNAIGESEI